MKEIHDKSFGPSLSASIAAIFFSLFQFFGWCTFGVLIVAMIFAIFHIDDPEGVLANIFSLIGVMAILCFFTAQRIHKESVEILDY